MGRAQKNAFRLHVGASCSKPGCAWAGRCCRRQDLALPPTRVINGDAGLGVLQHEHTQQALEQHEVRRASLPPATYSGWALLGRGGHGRGGLQEVGGKAGGGGG
jgi:hypothetical protein